MDDFPGDLSRIGYARETHRYFEDGSSDVAHDEWGMVPEASGLTNLAWTGFSLFRTRSDSPLELSEMPELPSLLSPRGLARGLNNKLVRDHAR